MQQFNIEKYTCRSYGPCCCGYPTTNVDKSKGDSALTKEAARVNNTAAKIEPSAGKVDVTAASNPLQAYTAPISR